MGFGSGLFRLGIGMANINDGKVILFKVFYLTKERRKNLEKKIKKKTENELVAVRLLKNYRKEKVKKKYKKKKKNEVKDKKISEDESKKGEADVQKITDDIIKKIDQIADEKEKSILTI